MSEYCLVQLIRVFGVIIEWVVVVGVSIMVVFDQVDFWFLVKWLELEIGYDQDGKFMVGCELVSCDVIDLKIGEVQIELIIFSVFIVVFYLGKMLVGCIYSLDLFEEEVFVWFELVLLLIIGLGSDGY